jgi:tetratricopeptide (TPR) repeat protein
MLLNNFNEKQNCKMIQVTEPSAQTTTTSTGSNDAEPYSTQNTTNQTENNNVECSESNVAGKTRGRSQDSMMFALFVSWILPVFVLAIFSRRLVDTTVPTIAIAPSPLLLHEKTVPSVKSATKRSANPKRISHQKPTRRSNSSTYNLVPSWGPVSYQEIEKSIKQRRRYIEGYSDRVDVTHDPKISAVVAENRETSTTINSRSINSAVENRESSSSRSINAHRRGKSSDPDRTRAVQEINELKAQYKRFPNNIYQAIALADSMRLYDIKYHEGGTYEVESIQLFNKIVEMANDLRQAAISRNEPTNRGADLVNEEIFVDYREKSIDGLQCAIYTAQGKVYFMANMFEKAVESYSNCLYISPYYLDAMNSRGSALLVLGSYSDAGDDFLRVIREDRRRLFVDAFSGMSRVLEAKEDSVPGGWDAVVDTAETLISVFEAKLANQPQLKQVASSILNRLHHFMFAYHDTKTNNYEAAFRHLTESYKHKMSSLPTWNDGIEFAKTQQTKRIFRDGFWPPHIGTPTRTPIFIIGFVRSGSTLLERILDSHPMIVGTGENSVFNGRLDDIRNQIVEASVSGRDNAISDLTKRLGEEVVDEMKNRWEIIDQNMVKDANETRKDPKRFVDKMLTNYYNVGFIHMLYPNALILHVVREPMDTLFSAYKHEFPSGTLDYTSDFKSLAELYSAYRDIMDHWDVQLPGRVTHILYQDMVKDTERIAKAIIEEVGLPWDESVLAFHKKKHAVNTLSSTQVRKGIYTSGIDSWKRYENELQPLVRLVGDYFTYKVSTSLSNYKAQVASSSEESCAA